MMIEGEVDIEGADALLMVEERNREDITLETRDNVLRIRFKAEEINECRAMINAIMNDLSCAEKLMEV